jgi:hypothetical protein
LSDAKWRTFRLGQTISTELTVTGSSDLWAAIQQAEYAQSQAKAHLDHLSRLQLSPDRSR